MSSLSPSPPLPEGLRTSDGQDAHPHGHPCQPLRPVGPLSPLRRDDWESSQTQTPTPTPTPTRSTGPDVAVVSLRAEDAEDGGAGTRVSDWARVCSRAFASRGLTERDFLWVLRREPPEERRWEGVAVLYCDAQPASTVSALQRQIVVDHRSVRAVGIAQVPRTAKGLALASFVVGSVTEPSPCRVTVL